MTMSKIVSEKYEHIYFQCGTYDESEFIDCIFLDVDIEGVWINEAVFKQCKFENTLFYGVQAYATTFHESTFSNVEFKGCNLSKANFSGCTFSNVAFGADNIGSITDISGACFEGVNLEGSIFFCVEYDNYTKFPKNFDPLTKEGLKLAQ
jgi:uncharacterized protein YjbI with pentapeptide repeats